MATSTFLSLEQFTFIAVPPESQISSLRVNIYADGRVYFVKEEIILTK